MIMAISLPSSKSRDSGGENGERKGREAAARYEIQVTQAVGLTGVRACQGAGGGEAEMH